MMAIECPSMDLREAEFFTEMSKVWWDKEGPFRIQLQYDSLVVPFIIEKIAKSRLGQEGFTDHEPLNGLNILDIGCGGGIVTEAISRKGGNIVGIDINRNMIKVAKDHLKLDSTIMNVKYHLQSVEEHSVENFQKYDVIILNAVLPHIVQKEPFLKCCINCLKPGGSAFLSAMSKTWASWLIGVHLVELLRMTPRGTCDWNNGITIEELGMILKKLDCKMLDSRGIYVMAIECPSMDLREAEYFTEMSKVWWDKEGPYRAQFHYDALVIPFIIEEIAKSRSGQEGFSDHKPLDGLTILEIGCGGGIVAEAISKKGGNIVGIDINRNVMEVAKAHLKLDPTIKNVKYHLQSVEDHSVQNFQKYDVIILNTVLQHIVQKEPFLKCCINCLKPGGLAFIAGMSKTWASWLVVVHLAEIFRITPRGTSDWNKGITIEELRTILKKLNCKMLDSRGLCYNILTDRFFFIKNESLGYIGHFIKEKGQLGN